MEITKEQLDKIEEKLDKLVKLLNPIVKVDKQLRADIFDVLAGKEPNNKLPRKQPDGSAWKKDKFDFNKTTHEQGDEKVAQDG